MSPLSLATANYMATHAPWQVISGPAFSWSRVGNYNPKITEEQRLCHTKSIVFQHPPLLYTEMARRPGSQRPPLLPFWLRVGYATLLLPHTHRCPGGRGNHENPDVCFPPFWLLSLPEASAHLPAAKRWFPTRRRVEQGFVSMKFGWHGMIITEASPGTKLPLVM